MGTSLAQQNVLDALIFAKQKTQPPLAPLPRADSKQKLSGMKRDAHRVCSREGIGQIRSQAPVLGRYVSRQFEKGKGGRLVGTAAVPQRSKAQPPSQLLARPGVHPILFFLPSRPGDRG